ncbi:MULTISPECIES: EF-hand domain-containing protein [unclassified Sphingomonas]|uniref:EF-hand domain-containing protein n=1 Tax=unclassified Sphingomonas TaxID=196159 RepID=UPI0022B41A75|nr:hypothetical protein [Sphingomonas sp. NIBR02145]WHU03741.1 hypothetical protein O3305_03840 [Sphingomonas sp. NIBR02145]
MKKFLLVAFAASAITAPAFAQDTPQRGGGMLSRLDTNGDGIVTKEEYNAGIAARFAALDTNKDGKVSEAEREAAGRGGGMGMRGMTGDVTLDQMQAQAAQRFDRIDANHDGKIDKAEMDAMMARMRDRQGPPPGSSGNN